MHSLLWIALIPSFTTALKFPVRQIRRDVPSNKINSLTSFNNFAVMDHDNAISSTNDVLYMATLKIDGVDYQLQMDTGSSDLWVNTTKVPTTLTNLSYNLTYGIGYAYGHIGRAPVSFAGYDVPDQAFLRYEQGNNPVFHFGAVGIVGLGFASPSRINNAVTTSGGSWGHSLLYNIFQLEPNVPNFIAFALDRITGPKDDVEGSFSLGEVDDKYAAIQSTDHIPLYPPTGASRWTLLVDSFASDGVSHELNSTVRGVPQGRGVGLLDTGTTYSYSDPSIAQAIYGSIQGAHLDDTLGQWIVPCTAGVYLTLWIAGRPFVIHPLDVVVPSLSDSSTCIGSFVPTRLSVGGGEFDWVLGTNVLRSIYSVYDFGDFDSTGNMGDPYIQLLSLVKITEAAVEFQQVRGGTVNVQDTNGNPTPNVSIAAAPEQLEKLVSVIPILFAIAGTNGLILLILLVGAIWFCCYRRKNKTKKVAPLPLAIVNAATHSYEAVSTTEDGQGRPSLARSQRRTRPTSRQSQCSITMDNEPPHSPLKAQSDIASRRSRYSSLKPQAGEGYISKRSSYGSLAHQPPTPTKNGFASVEGQLLDVVAPEHHSADITDGVKKPFHPVPPPPIMITGYRRSAYSENAASPTVAGSEQGFQLHDSPVRLSVTVPNGIPSPTASQFEDARGSMYSVTAPPPAPMYAHPGASASNVSVSRVATQPPPLPLHADPRTPSRQQEAQRAAFMAALDDAPLPPPRRPRGFGSGGQTEDPRQRLSAYSAAPVVSHDMGVLVEPPNVHANRHSYTAPGASITQRSTYVPGSGRRPPFNPSPFNPSSGNGN